MTSDDRDSIESLALRRHAELFASCSDCTPILGVLRANNVINEVEYQRIKAKQTSIEKNGCVSYSYITTTSVISVLLHKTEGAARGRV